MNRLPGLPLRPALLFGLFLALSLGGAAGARGEPPPLTLSAAVERALAAHPSLHAALAEQEAFRAAAGEARITGRPVARLLATGTRYGDPLPVTPIHGFSPGHLPAFDETLVQGTLSVRTTLWDAGARRARIRQSEAEAAAAGEALDTLADGVRAGVVSAYASVLARRDLLAAATGRRDAVAAELARVGELLAAGRAPEVERLRAEAALAAAEAETSRAATALDSAERDLARLTALDVTACRAARLAPLGFGGTAPVAEAERLRLQDDAVAGSPAVARAREQVAAAEAARAQVRTALYPTLEAVGALQELGDGRLSFATEWQAGLQLSLLLFDSGATGRRLARADALLAAARARLAEAELAAREAVDRALAARADALARAGALGRAAARLVEVARVEQLLLEVGTGTQVDYLAAEAELAATRAAVVEARTLALVAEVELARATGALTPAWIAHLETRP